MSQQDILTLFDSLSEQEQVEFVKQALIDKISKAECWGQCDLRAILRILRLIGRVRRHPVS